MRLIAKQVLTTEDNMRILLIEDNEIFGDVIKRYLQKEGYTIDWFKDADAANAILQMNEHFDLAIIDLEIAGWSWRQWLETFKEKKPIVPVLMITGSHSTTLGLNIGADTYLIKYQTDREKLLSSVRALLRRSAAAQAAVNSVLKYKHIALDLNAREVKVDGEIVVCSRLEFALLHKLLTHVGRVVTREELMQSLYGWDNKVDSNTLEVHLYNLRRKLKTDRIKTIRGIGYMLVEDAT